MSLIYGIHAVAEALKARRVSRLVHERGAGPRVDALVARAHELRIPIETRRSARARQADARRRASGRRRPSCSRCRPTRSRSWSRRPPGRRCSSCSTASRTRRTSARSCGRADAAGAHGVIRQARHAAPLDGATAKASAGAVNHVRIATVVNISRALEELKELNVWTVGFDADGDRVATTQVDYTLPTALVLGAEGTGLRRLVRETCDRLVSHPDGGAGFEPERVGHGRNRAVRGGPAAPASAGA